MSGIELDLEFTLPKEGLGFQFNKEVDRVVGNEEEVSEKHNASGNPW